MSKQSGGSELMFFIVMIIFCLFLGDCIFNDYEDTKAHKFLEQRGIYKNEMFNSKRQTYYYILDPVLRFYYKKIRDNLISNGYSQNNILDISNEIYIRVSPVRNLITDPEYKINQDIINITKYEVGKELQYGSDYIIEYKNEKYCIPVEALDYNGNIAVDKICNWKIEDKLEL